MIKVIWLLKKFIVCYTFLHFLLIAALVHYTSKDFFQNPLANIISFNGIFCMILAYFVYIYINQALVFNEKDTEVNFLDNVSCVFGGILFCVIILFMILYEAVTGEKISLLGIMIFLIFVAAPVTWIKLIINLNIWFWSKVLSIFININTGRYILKKERKGELSILEAFNAFVFTSATSEILETKLNISIDENRNSLNINDIKNTDFIFLLNEKWNYRKNVTIFLIVLIFGVGNLIHTCLTF